MNKDIRDRLRRLGVHKGAGNLKPALLSQPRPGHAQGATEAVTYVRAPRESEVDVPLWNIEQDTDYGPAYVRRTRYTLDHRHGSWALQDVLARPLQTLARLNNGVGIDLHNALFLDTETTGLAGGSGTLVFLVGLGYFDTRDGQDASDSRDAGAVDSFVVDQYFLHEPAQEAAMLTALNERVAQARTQALITFNGRGFDVPLLETRFTLSRIASALGDLVHLDLLLPARRAWRVELGSCSLGSLEYHMLEVRRDQQDIPGFLIPQLYREYLMDRAPAEMQRVMYHNLHDILSMVSLVSRLCGAVDAPANMGEYLAVGQYYENLGQLNEAEAVYSAALAGVTGGPGAAYNRVLQRLADCLKRQNHRDNAAPYWRKLAEAGDVEAWIELAKHYEWHEVDLAQALACAQGALAATRDRLTRDEITHRIERLQRKMK
jgi:uncharacterized protein YprB with RNaseH-like and TPR domain